MWPRHLAAGPVRRTCPVGCGGLTAVDEGPTSPVQLCAASTPPRRLCLLHTAVASRARGAGGTSTAPDELG